MLSLSRPEDEEIPPELESQYLLQREKRTRVRAYFTNIVGNKWEALDPPKTVQSTIVVLGTMRGFVDRIIADIVTRAVRENRSLNKIQSRTLILLDPLSNEEAALLLFELNKT